MVAEGQQKVLYLQIPEGAHMSPEYFDGGLLPDGGGTSTEGTVILSEELITKISKTVWEEQYKGTVPKQHDEWFLWWLNLHDLYFWH